MLLIESLSNLLTSFDFWRFYLCMFAIVISAHVVINLILDTVIDSSRSIHVFLFIVATCPMSLVISAHYFNPFGEKMVEKTELTTTANVAKPKIKVGEQSNSDITRPKGQPVNSAVAKPTVGDAQLLKEFRDSMK